MFNRTSNLMGQDPRSFVAPANPLLQQAGGQAGALNSGGNPLYGQAADMTRNLLGGGDPSASAGQWGNVSKYYNPYEADVVNATAAGMDQADQMAQRQNEMRFGGHQMDSPFALSQALLGGQQSLARGQTLGNLRYQGYHDASQLADSQAARDNAVNMLNAQLGAQMFGQRLQGAGQLGQIANDQGANQRADIGTMGNIGGTLQNIDQAQSGAPINVLGQLTGNYGALGPLVTGQDTVGTQKQSAGLLGQLGQAAQIAALFASDVRVKQDIVKVGDYAPGIGVYDFAYVWAPGERYRGVMAQELLAAGRGDAVAAHPSGYLMVDYARL